MALAANTAQAGLPFVKLTRLGDTFTGAFAGSTRRQRRKFQTEELLTKDDGKPLLEEVMWFIALPNATGYIGKEDEPQPIESMERVRYSVHGYGWGKLIEARKTLAAVNGFKTGQTCSGDIYTLTLTGWTAATDDVAKATKAGFTVKDGRIQISTQADLDKYVLATKRSPAKEVTVEVRRPTPTEKAWEQAADELFLTKPWENGGAGETAVDGGDEEPF